MFIQTIPLRIKLIASMLIPLAVVVAFLGVQVLDASSDRAAAADQVQAVEQFEALTSYGFAAGDEIQTLIDPLGTEAELAAARTAAAEAWTLLADPESGLDPAQLGQVEVIVNELNDLRSTIGSDPVLFRDQILTASDLRTFDASAVLFRFAQLHDQLINAVEFDSSQFVSVSSLEKINDLRLIERARSTRLLDAVALIRLENVGSADPGAQVISFVREGANRVNSSNGTVADLASIEVGRQFATIVASPAETRLAATRVAFSDLPPGEQPVGFTSASIAQDATEIDTELALIGSGVSAALQAESAAFFVDAEDQMIRSGAIGGGLIFMTALVLFALYRAIRNPLRELTAQSRRITEVDLPEIVRAVRDGEIDSMPEIEPMEAYTRDEVGELVASFNGMHSTAVELAVEQAGSRRVVADMFVNLGRRNQKLLNRMLRGLAQLEQEEQDADKLEALYQVDHLATRMRRNAESLLILAGASQARTFSRPVPVYDVVQAALSEVEGYDRVIVDVAEGAMVKGEYVADLAHMLAELTENALTFSPPGSPVQIIAQPSRRGFVIVVNDEGIGMPAEALAEANERIASAATQAETPSEFLGHYVVGRLAARAGFNVSLLEGLAGVSARIAIPEFAFDGHDDNEPAASPVDTEQGLSSLSSLSQSAEAPAAAIAPAAAAAPVDDVPTDEFALDSDAADAGLEPDERPAAVIYDEFALPEESDDVSEGAAFDEFALADEADEFALTDAVDEFALTDEVDSTRSDDLSAPHEPAEVVTVHADASQPLVIPGELPRRRPRADRSVAEQPSEQVEPSTPSVSMDGRPILSDPPAGVPAVLGVPIPAPEADNAPTIDSNDDSTADSTDEATSDVFAVTRRTPGAQLPTSSKPKAVAEVVDHGDAETVRSSLSGFQNAVAEADVTDVEPAAEASPETVDDDQLGNDHHDEHQHELQEEFVDQLDDELIELVAESAANEDLDSGTGSAASDESETAETPEDEPADVDVFAVQRRTPGANLPTTTINKSREAAPELGDADVVRSSLSGFQSGTALADKENT